MYPHIHGARIHVHLPHLSALFIMTLGLLSVSKQKTHKIGKQPCTHTPPNKSQLVNVVVLGDRGVCGEGANRAHVYPT